MAEPSVEHLTAVEGGPLPLTTAGAPAAERDGRAVLERRIEGLFAAGREEQFEEGMESEFSRGLVAIVEQHGDEAVAGIADLILNEKVAAHVASEALVWLATMDHPPSHDARLRLLQQALFSRTLRTRDSATVGLSAMDDPRAISDLKKASSGEHYAYLRRDMEKVLGQLESTLPCRDS
ncbi:MAG: hypothetical protein HY000_24290 [Planctomycetes bacterium]|nr:hypothetical protein [Planctomycetota bacterium]